MSSKASEQMSAAERASEASSAEQENEWAVGAIERADERMAQYPTRRFHINNTRCAPIQPFTTCLARAKVLLSIKELQAQKRREENQIRVSFYQQFSV